jgi:hypothetical protein
MLYFYTDVGVPSLDPHLTHFNLVKEILTQYVYISHWHVNIRSTGNIFSVWTRSMALHFMAAGASLAVRHVRILPMNQHA